MRMREYFIRLFKGKAIAECYERQHASAKRSDEEEGLDEDGTSEVCFDRNGSFDCLSLIRACKRVHG